MARPRIFISSTFYDLKQIRADMEQFVRELGYDPVLNERGSIPYSGTEKLEESAYKEVELSDVLVAIIGGRYGQESKAEPYSISQMELKTALDQGKQVFIFIEQAVRAEHGTYLMNKDLEGIRYQSVDNPKIFQFIEEIEALPLNNAIAPFETAQDITSYLREQWAGLLQRFLREQTLLRETRMLVEMQTSLDTLDRLVTFLTEERRKGDSAIREILLANHPAFAALRKAMNAPYRLYFASHKEMGQYLTARSWTDVDVEEWDDPDYEEWLLSLRPRQNAFKLIKVHRDIFDGNGRLKVFTGDDWDQKWISVEQRAYADEEFPASAADDDIPF